MAHLREAALAQAAAGGLQGVAYIFAVLTSSINFAWLCFAVIVVLMLAQMVYYVSSAAFTKHHARWGAGMLAFALCLIAFVRTGCYAGLLYAGPAGYGNIKPSMETVGYFVVDFVLQLVVPAALLVYYVAKVYINERRSGGGKGV